MEAFDSGEVERGKSLGKFDLDIIEVPSMDGPEGKWFLPFSVKSGKVLVSADLVNRDVPPSLLARGVSKVLMVFLGERILMSQQINLVKMQGII